MASQSPTAPPSLPPLAARAGSQLRPSFLQTPTQRISVQANSDPVNSLKSLEDEIRRGVEAARERNRVDQADEATAVEVTPLPEEKDGVPLRIAQLREAKALEVSSPFE
ncbi:hypothetical protein ADEAN_000026900 [Angomonas deanei]|uniref:Uncharacterized protein n=1 Tax=Angomonas deanei TaxID=59799 RepID=A0A7G2C2D0_9TRYP|nr:hypothetical protein ADEAN_000026900 [Angomonas deanei]